MKSKLIIGIATVSLAAVGVGAIYAADDKYTVKVPGGLAFSEFEGYESWQMIAASRQTAMSGDARGDGPFAVILGNPAMIEALDAGIPDNGKPFPDGAKMAKMHYAQKPLPEFPTAVMVTGTQLDVDFMVKDSARFADGGGWGYAAFKRDAASGAFRPFTTQDTPPQANDAKCGVACHSVAKSRDYVFTRYVTR
jgi:Cytochrome P460